MGKKGFTLLEITIALAIVAIGSFIAFSNLEGWNTHNQFVGFQREVLSEMQIDLDAETVTLERGNAGSGSTAWSADRTAVSAPRGSGIADLVHTLAGASSTVSGSRFFLVFNPAGDVYRMASGVVTPVDTVRIHLSGLPAETATIQLFCWTGKARLSVGTI
jgi:prepilin-type N-terminal cleavage/methylation domain-containing protein